MTQPYPILMRRGVTRFSRFVTHAKLIVPRGADEPTARKLLERAEHGCLIANSLRAERHLEMHSSHVRPPAAQR